jgi:hypothetical protein
VGLLNRIDARLAKVVYQSFTGIGPSVDASGARARLRPRPPFPAPSSLGVLEHFWEIPGLRVVVREPFEVFVERVGVERLERIGDARVQGSLVRRASRCSPDRREKGAGKATTLRMPRAEATLAR